MQTSSEEMLYFGWLCENNLAEPTTWPRGDYAVSITKDNFMFLKNVSNFEGNKNAC